MKSAYLKSAIAAVLLGATAMAFGAGPGSGGGGGGGGGGPGGPPDGHGNRPDSEAGFSLSLPTVFAGGQGQFTALSCGTDGFSELEVPDKDPVAYPYACAETHDGEVCRGPGNYYVQRDAVWQAPCQVTTAGPVAASAKWGDNLAGGDAKLTVGSPIRVELLLWDSVLSAGFQGYNVVKLEPSELDRMSDYGHLATGTEGNWAPIAYEVGKAYTGNTVLGEFDGTFRGIVFDPAAEIKIEKLEASGNVTIVDEPAGGEINAGGKIVYGYNLRVVENGTYRITYTTPNVTMTCLDAVADCSAGNATFLEIVVPSEGGGGEGEDVLVKSNQGGKKPKKPHPIHPTHAANNR